METEIEAGMETGMTVTLVSAHNIRVFLNNQQVPLVRVLKFDDKEARISVVLEEDKVDYFEEMLEKGGNHSLRIEFTKTGDGSIKTLFNEIVVLVGTSFEISAQYKLLTSILDFVVTEKN